MRKRLLSLMLVLILLAGCLFACGDGGGGGGGDGGSAGGGEKHIVMADSKGEDSLDPTFSYSSWYDTRYGILETLYRLDSSLELQEWLGTDYQNIDERTWQVTIRDDVNFSNGTKLTAQAVADALTYNCQNNGYVPEAFKTATFTADGQTLTIQTVDPSPTMIYDLTDPFYCIMDVHSGTDFATNPIGTGPYIVDSFTAKSSCTLHANENYWGGEPKIQTVEYRVIMDTDTMSMAIQNGEIDWATGVSAENVSLFEDNENYNVYEEPTGRLFFLYFNMNNEHLAKVNVRRAICMAMDKETMCEELLSGSSTPTYAVFPDSLPFGDSTLDYDGYDFDAAVELLAQEGYEKDSGGTLLYEGEPVHIRVVTGGSRPEALLLAEGIMVTLGELGFETEMINSADDTRTVMSTDEFELGFYNRMTAPTGDAYAMLSSTFGTDAYANYSHYSNERVDELLAELEVEMDTDRRNQLAIDIQQQVLDDAAVLNFCHLKTFVITGANVTGVQVDPNEYYHLSIDLDIN